jgi:transcription antitermination protein NusB
MLDAATTTEAEHTAPVIQVAVAKKQKVAGARRMARMYAVMAVYTLEHGRSGLAQVSADFLQHIIDSDMFGQALVAPDVKLFQGLVRDTLAHVSTIDAALQNVLNNEQKRDFTRLDAVLRAVLRVSANELTYQSTTTPAPIIMNEYIEVARAFFGDEQRIPAMVNGVQNALWQQVRAVRARQADHPNTDSQT